MRRLLSNITVCAGVAVCVAVTGCGMQVGGSTATAKGGLAVVDLDVVAKTLGRQQEMQQEINTAQNAVVQALGREEQTLNRQLADLRERAGDSPTDEHKVQLGELQKRYNFLLQQRDAAVTQLQKNQISLVNNFRSEIRPVAQEIAAKKGLSVVIPKNEGLLLSVDPGVDITADVIQAMKSKATPAGTAAAKPATATTTSATGTAPAAAPPEKLPTSQKVSEIPRPEGNKSR